MFHSHTNCTRLIEQVNSELDKISARFNCNKLLLNINKTDVIIFTPENKKYNKHDAVIKVGSGGLMVRAPACRSGGRWSNG